MSAHLTAEQSERLDRIVVRAAEWEGLEVEREKLIDAAEIVADLGIDALDVMDHLSLDVEGEFAIVASHEEWAAVRTLGDLRTLVATRLAEQEPRP